MSTLGKILLFFNLLLAAVVLLVAGMDHGKRQSWRYAALRHRLVPAGLPVNSKDYDEKEPDVPLLEDLKGGVLKEVFANAGGGAELGGSPVATCEEELARVHAKVKTNISTSADAKRQAREYLLPQAVTIGERVEIIQMINSDDASMTKTLLEVDRRFSAAKTSVSGAAPSLHEERVKIAALLAMLSADATWRQRVMTVVGMSAYVEAINRQAEALAQMGYDLQRLIVNDRATFERQYHTLAQTIFKETDELYKAGVYLAELKATVAEREKQLAQRKTEVQDEEAMLAQARADASTEIGKLQLIQADLFKLQQRMGLAMQRNQQLEQELRQLELKSGR